MKTKTSTAITIPSIVPQPRKEDIITAMTERASVKHSEESQRLEKLRATAEAKLDAAIMKEFKDHPCNFQLDVKHYLRPEVEYMMIAVPSHIAQLKAALNSIPSLRPFDFATTKKKIREGMKTTGDRVKAILNNPLAVEALDAALLKITNK